MVATPLELLHGFPVYVLLKWHLTIIMHGYNDVKLYSMRSNVQLVQH